MKRIEIRAYGKINLSLDVLERLENGYHRVEMVMQQIQLYDNILLRWFEVSDMADFQGQDEAPSRSPISIEVSTNKIYLPTDERNLAYKAALLMAQTYGQGKKGKIRIDIKKNIPVAAGLAGGSSNGAAVLHGLSRLWNLNLDVAQLCQLGIQLGADVPFSIMGQAKANSHLALTQDPLASHCALATGIGEQLQPIAGLDSYLVLTKPPISVSTRVVYQGLQPEKLTHPCNTAELMAGLEEGRFYKVRKNMYNALETFTLKKYPTVKYTKNKVQQLLRNRPVLMSGSGPTVYVLCPTKGEAQYAWRRLCRYNKETFWTHTTY